jgi:acyl-activating enzyme 14
MTEACSSLTFMPINKPEFHETKNKSSNQCEGVCVGKPAPHVEIQIGRNESNSSSSPMGKILTRGLHTMVGYWGNNMVDTPESVRNGWLDTGDTGWIDRTGNLWLMGRQKGRIKSGGENVYPEEVLIVLLVYSQADILGVWFFLFKTNHF